jgi:GNAT superfamily N-acetyltransferase
MTSRMTPAASQKKSNQAAPNKKAASKKAAVAKKTASKKTASKKTASKKTASKKTASKKTATKKTASKKTATKKTASKKTALTFKPVTASTWKDFEALFQAKGGPSYCWCMPWRTTGKEATTLDKHGRKRAMKQRAHDGTPIGLLGYADGASVAWVSLGPRESFNKGFAPVSDDDAPGSVWCVTCFFVQREHRGQGTTLALLEAAVRYAKRRGATLVEATPVDPTAPSYRFMCFVPRFQDEGFVHIGRVGSRRHVMRKALR